MHRLKFLFLFSLVAVCSISMASADNSYSAEEQEMLEMINEERAEHGLSPLKFNPILNEVSSAHSKEMIEKDYFSHNSYDGTSFWQRLKDSGYKTNAAAENIAMTLPFDVEKAHEKLMASSGHRNNILNPDYNEIGIGIWVGNYTYNGKTYSNVAMFTQDFGWSDSATVSPEPLSIESSYPESDQSSYCDESLKFSISTNRPCDIKWFVDGTIVKTSDNVDTSTYTGSKPSPGTYRVKAMVVDDDYTGTKVWEWIVSEDESESSKYHPYDFNQNCVIDTIELSKAIDDYRAGKLSFQDISQLIDYWQIGSEGYC